MKWQVICNDEKKGRRVHAYIVASRLLNVGTKFCSITMPSVSSNNSIVEHRDSVALERHFSFH